MAYCQNCGAALESNANFCPGCGVALTSINTSNQQWSETAKAVGAVAGAAVGLSMLNRISRRRHRPPVNPHHCGPHGGPMGMHRMRGPGGHGPLGPGGRRDHRGRH